MARSDPPEPERDVKVRIPVHLITKLHSVKILEGRTIRDVVVEALERYYERPETANILHAARVVQLGRGSGGNPGRVSPSFGGER